MDYEEMMLQITDVLKANNRYRLGDFEQAIKLIREIVTPKGKWKIIGLVGDYAYCTCSECGNTTRLYRDSKNEFCCLADIRKKAVACLYCGARME